jgi:hypothetical protein
MDKLHQEHPSVIAAKETNLRRRSVHRAAAGPGLPKRTFTSDILALRARRNSQVRRDGRRQNSGAAALLTG